jgi:hypothetical protein
MGERGQLSVVGCLGASLVISILGAMMEVDNRWLAAFACDELADIECVASERG